MSKKLHDELSDVSPKRESVLTIGVFDGVHKGHHYLFSRLVSEAADSGRLAGIITLRNHPALVLGREAKPFYITTVNDRVRLLRELGVDFVVPITFNMELSQMRASQFIAILRDRLCMSGLVVGPDFAMGYERDGNVSMLMSLGGKTGFSVSVVEPLMENHRRIASTEIREMLIGGDVDKAAFLLGRNFVLSGTVIKGAGRGIQIGFPTANLSIAEDLIVPGHGIYAAWANLGRQRYMAAVSIGTNPTFGEGDQTVEAFVLDFDGDLYGKKLLLEFVSRLRAEIKYDSVNELRSQICNDVCEIKKILDRKD